MRDAGQLPAAPPDFAERAQALFSAVGTSPEALGAVLDDAERLAAEVCGGLGG